MSQGKLSLIIIFAVGLSLCIYSLLNTINPNTLIFNLSIKCLKSTKLTVEYQSKKDETIKVVSNEISPSQLNQLTTFELSDFDDSKFLTLYLGDSATTVFIDLFLFSVTEFSQTKYIHHWSPVQSQSDIISSVHQCYIADQNKQTIQIETSNGKNRLDLNISSLNGKIDYINSTGFIQLKTWLASITLSLLLLLIIVISPAPGILKLNLKLSRLPPLLVIFFGVLFFSTINSFFKWVPDLKNSENRVLSILPTYSLKSTYQYTDLISKYVDDHFPFRNYMFYINSFIRLKCFNEAVLADMVIPGHNDFFFYNQNGTIRDFRHLSSIDTNIGNQVISNLINQQKWLAERNCKLIILFAPNKARIYPDKLPTKYTVRSDQGYNTFDYYKALISKNGSVSLIDPTDSLLLARQKNEVYYPGDTHWNYYGAFKAYQCIMDELKISFPLLSAIGEDELNYTESFNRIGDLLSMIGLGSDYFQKEILFQFKNPAYTLNYNNPPLINCIFRHNETLNKSHLKVIVLGDSFSYFLMPFLNKHFEQSIYLKHYTIIPSLIELEKPDVVIIESVERLLNNSLNTPIAGQIEF